MDDANEVAPGKPMLERSNRALLTKRPYFVKERLKADAMLINSPQF
jgi:hypothetical protein